MALDVVIRGGTIIDGTGKEGYAGDVGIKDGRIVSVGKVTESATQTIDAEGAIVTPGFTDVHCHYDGQVSWDGDLAPSCLHGVTTCVIGNCGVGFAPCKENDRDDLIRLMEGVEDIPGTALAEGLTWQWESFPEYMDAIDSFPHTIDFASQVTHDALRVFVMGERGASGQDATEDDIKAMRQLVREALEAGAVGFSTGRSDNHRSADGKETPASEASTRELMGIAEAFKGLNHGVLQAVSDFDVLRDPERFDVEFDIIEKYAKAGGGRPFSLSLMQRDQAPMQWRQILDRCEAMDKAGQTVRCQVAARAIGVMLGLEATFNPFMGFPSYKEISQRPREDRVKAMRDPAFKARLLKEKSEPMAGDGSPIPPLADMLLANLDAVSMRLFRLGEIPNYEPTMEDCLYNEGFQKGISSMEAIYDALLEQDGKELLYFPLYNYTGFNLDTLREMMTHPLAMPGLSDGGAHVGTVCDASFPTFMLQHWGRDRATGRLPIERIVQMLAGDTSAYMGFTDRGTLTPGKLAHVNVIDMKELQLQRPTLIDDLPAGGKRLLQHATGYRATLVKGHIIARNGKLTGEQPGRLVRGKAAN